MDARRTLIADASLAVVGANGVRGLTHHRIDDEAGIARGSTSYYCRRRVDVLRLALTRLYDLDIADITAMVASVPPDHRHDHAVVTGAVADLIVDWLSGDHRARSIARVELFMAASHEPELQAQIAEQFAQIAEVVQPLGGGDAAAGGRVAARLMLADGLMLMVLRQGLPAPSREHVAGLLALVAGDSAMPGLAGT